ncbi:MAG: hypothetical protein AABM32_10770 [Chloroflexota bacterium]
MSEWALKLGSVVTTLLVLAGGYGYASTHVKNPNAPLQPPVEKSPEAAQATPTPTPIPSLVGTRRGQQSRATSSPAPRLTLQPGVQATELPEVTFTHTS